MAPRTDVAKSKPRLWHPGSSEEYSALRQEITAWYQRMSGVYAISLAALAVLLKLQTDKPELSGAAFMTISSMSWLLIALILRTYALATRQASYIKVAFEAECGDVGWVSRTRKAWDDHMGAVPLGIRWTKAISEQKIFCGLLFAVQLVSAWLVLRQWFPDSPKSDAACPIVVFAAFIVLNAIFFKPDPDGTHGEVSWVITAFEVGISAWVTFVSTLHQNSRTDFLGVKFIAVLVMTIDLVMFRAVTRDRSRAWEEMWKAVLVAEKEEASRSNGTS